MEQKRVSFGVAQAIKEAGYPQGLHEMYVYAICNHRNSGAMPHYKEGELLSPSELDECNYCESDLIVAPTYLDVWLWLWREKGIRFDIEDLWDVELSYPERGCASNTNQLGGICTPEVSDPEEAIITAIEHLVDNKLLK